MSKLRRRKLSRPKRPSKPEGANSSRVTFKKVTLHRLDWLEWTTIGLAAWFLFFPRPYEILLGVLLAIPIIGLFINGLHRPSIASLVEVSVKSDGDHYDVADFIDVAAWIILIRVFMDYNFESIYSLIIPGTIAFVIILIILFLTHKAIANTTRDRRWIYVALIFNVSIYSYAGTYAANCTYDYSEPEVYKTAVLGKSIRKIGKRRGKLYYVEVAPWGHRYDGENVRVSRERYDNLSIGDSIDISVKKGLFDIPWFYVAGNPEPRE